jgi:DNA-binding MurR/RpiR family transcriptional regulator
MTAISDVHQLISDVEFDETVEKILAARRILVFGSGASGYIAGDLYHKLVRLGFDALVCTDSHLMSIHSAMAKPDDLMILVSHSGETKTILSCAEEGLNRHCNLLSLCSYQHSSLVEKTKLVLLSSTNETRLRPDATTSRILQLVIIDIIVILLTKCLGQDGFDAIKRSQVAVASLKK